MNRLAVAAVVSIAVAGPAFGQVPSPGRIGLTVEGLNFWQGRNDVRIPPDSGTPFSIVELIGRAPTPSVRGELTVGLTERQELRLVYAPLRITGRGTPAAPIAFAGGRFEPVATDAEYQFSSYRGTWRYRVHHGDTWTWRVGVTAFVRDARIALSQIGQAAEDTDVGFVPLGHVSADARLSSRWHLGFDLDGSAAPQGRAFDFSATLNYRPHPRLTLSAGYRTIEGGADVDAVFAFAWLHAAVARVGVRF
ncbi:MAG: hypothetical protein AB7U83_15330 [Vicinamibacterales bacterium]